MVMATAVTVVVSMVIPVIFFVSTTKIAITPVANYGYCASQLDYHENTLVWVIRATKMFEETVSEHMALVLCFLPLPILLSLFRLLLFVFHVCAFEWH